MFLETSLANGLSPLLLLYRCIIMYRLYKDRHRLYAEIISIFSQCQTFKTQTNRRIFKALVQILVLHLRIFKVKIANSEV